MVQLELFLERQQRGVEETERYIERGREVKPYKKGQRQLSEQTI